MKKRNARPPGSPVSLKTSRYWFKGRSSQALLPETQVFQGEQEIAGADAAAGEEADHAPAVAEHFQPAVACLVQYIERIGGGG